jgi:Rrf2 family protein
MAHRFVARCRNRRRRCGEKIADTAMLTAKAIYAFRTLFHLATLPPGERIVAAQIKRDCALPDRFGETVLTELKHAGLVDSTRGPHGGYQLARPPDEISWADVVRAIDGPIAWTKCVSQSEPGRCNECPEPENCVIRKIMARVRAADLAILENLSIADDIDPGIMPAMVAAQARNTMKRDTA